LSAKRLHALIEEFLLHVTVLPWDSDSAQQYGLLRATLEREGQPMRNLDMMIGAHALALKLILITNDRSFDRIEGMRLKTGRRHCQDRKLSPALGGVLQNLMDHYCPVKFES
jgi:predicted nucleic acid-binding protein